MNKPQTTILKKQLNIFLLLCAAVSIALIIYLMFYVNHKLKASANANLSQAMDQIAQTVSSTWISDAANIRELATVLANTDNKEAVMSDIRQNDIVYRYLFTDGMKTEAPASDGASVKKNDALSFTVLKQVPEVEASEAFYGNMGKWCYLYRCPVLEDGELCGWIYAQYLFDRLSSLLPESVYEGSGNCYILDEKTSTIVFQQDIRNKPDRVGLTLEDFFAQSRIGNAATTSQILSAIAANEEGLFFTYIGGNNMLVYIRPMETNPYYLVGLVDESAVLQEATGVRRAIVLIISFLLGVIVIIALIIYQFIKERMQERRAHDEEMEAYSGQLQEALKRADSANRFKSEFLANMSHEIRTPVNAVIGMNEMILRESKNPAIRSYAADIHSAAQTILHTINQILDISKIESGKLELLPTQYDLCATVQDLFKIVSVRAKEKYLRLNVQMDQSLPSRLYGDDIRIRQILTNLLTNAIKYTKEGSVTLQITGEKKDGDILLRISVNDTGIGIRAEDLPKLTEKYRRIEESRNRGVEGTGLGMSITVQLLQLMGSRLHVESEYGIGSRFWFLLRQGIVDETPVGNIQEWLQEENAVAPHADASSFTAPGARLLVVDDNRINRRVFQQLLKPTKVQIDTAESGKQCLELVRRNAYHIIFLDHLMPEMDGIETLHALRAVEGFDRNTPVIALTANAIVGAEESYLREGFHGYLPKPIVYEQLEQIIIGFLPKELLQKEEAAPQKAPADDPAPSYGFTGELPPIEGINWSYAGLYAPDAEFLKDVAKNFYHSLKSDKMFLQEKLSLLDQTEDREAELKAFRIRVHSLKSTAASVGALTVCELARLLESYAGEGDVCRMQTLMPFLAEAMDRCEKALRVLEPPQEQEKPAPSDLTQTIAWTEMLKGQVFAMNMDQADELLRQIRSYSYPPEIQALVDELAAAVVRFDEEAVLAAGDKLINIWREELTAQ